MTEHDQRLKQFDEKLAELEKAIKQVQEQRREYINQNGLNKTNDVNIHGAKLRLADLKIGDKFVIPYYDDRPCTVDIVDPDDEKQPVHVRWDDGTQTWPEQRHVCNETRKI
ncbi:TPA: hypothetical protein ACNBW6_003861 [Escherichia coli]